MSFKYLGSTVVKDGGYDIKVGRRIKAEWRALKKVKGVYSQSKVQKWVKSRFHTTMLRPRIRYEMEVVSLTKTLKHSLDMAEMKMSRLSFEATRRNKMQSKLLRKKINIGACMASLEKCASRKKNSYVGKMVQLPHVEKRKRGKPKRRWMDCLKEDMQIVGLRKDEHRIEHCAEEKSTLATLFEWAQTQKKRRTIANKK